MGRQIEVDEEVYNRGVMLQQKLAQIVNKPEAKKLLQKAHKMVDPGAITPELDQEEALAKASSDVRADFEAYKKAQEEKEAKALEEKQRTDFSAKWNAGRDKVMRERGFTADGAKALEEWMSQEGITNWEVAADHWEKQHPPEAPAMPGGTGAWNFLDFPTDDTGDKFVKELIDTKGQKDLVADRAAQAVLAEIRGPQSRR